MVHLKETQIYSWKSSNNCKEDITIHVILGNKNIL